MKSLLKIAALIFFCSALTSCSVSQKTKIISPEGLTQEINWTAEERAKDLAIRTLKTTLEASYHVIRLATLEPPHTHDTHDAVVFMRKGKVQISVAGKTYIMKPGDVVEIPRGVIHWAKNLDRNASEVFAVFTPPFDGKDRHLVENK